MSLSLTLKGHIEVRHISERRNLETLADTAKFIINDGEEVIPFHLLLLTLT